MILGSKLEICSVTRIKPVSLGIQKAFGQADRIRFRSWNNFWNFLGKYHLSSYGTVGRDERHQSAVHISEIFLFTFKMHWKDQQKMPRMDQFKK